MNHTGDARPRAVTIYDVARAAGVATSTASRALSNPGRVSERTRAHVAEVAERLGYVPNRMAQALPSGRTGLFALLVPDVTNPHHVGLIRGAEAQAAAAGHSIVLADGQEDAAIEAAHLRRLGSFVDGFLLVSPRGSADDLAPLLRRHPAAVFNRPLAGLPGVVADIDAASAQTVEHLAGLGHRTLVYLRGPETSWADGERRRTLTAHAERHGVSFHAVGPHAPVLGSGSAAAEAGLATGATALVAFNDLIAIGVLQHLERAGVPVPGDVSVVGADDVFGASFCHPPLTTVTSPAEPAGRALVDLVTGTAPDDPVLPSVLVVRESTGPARSSRSPRGVPFGAANR
ncbi:LacI family DNA-binding transcriptional regulator [Pseudonocardia oroxyli]|uniref:Transcriptional regulator, LacI family n=1 Tax=Pseudonocardia oroxyli TaxID=366584 RepID=A0A1G7X643_PSEOR|nr:LacI family DNA-binding transcriptional regulator [Pseudonocardia oroxyli]SDG79617.1 transcriptional regulator, LacI family [Pseudonocardia oroxyli]